VDDPTGFIEPEKEPFHLLTLDDVLPPNEGRPFLFWYTAFELCNVGRAFLHRYLYEKTQLESWIYLDSDIQVLNSLHEAFEILDGKTGLITPHCLGPCQPFDAKPVETGLLKYGIFNSGFLGIRRCSEAQQFIEWFESRLFWFCFFLEEDVFVDQLWLNFLPVYFPGFHIWTHPGANVSYWNLHERVLKRSSDGITANNQNLLFIHFSQWKIEDPEDWTFGRPVLPQTDRSIIAETGRNYRQNLLDNQWEVCRPWPYGFSQFSNGTPIPLPLRRQYYEGFKKGQFQNGSPFENPDWFHTSKSRRSLKSLFPRFAHRILG